MEQDAGDLAEQLTLLQPGGQIVSTKIHPKCPQEFNPKLFSLEFTQTLPTRMQLKFKSIVHYNSSTRTRERPLMTSDFR